MVLNYHGGMSSGRGPSSAGRAKETGAPRFFWMHRSCFALLRAWTSLVEWSFLWSFGTSPMISPTCPAYFCRNAYVSPWAACASHPWNWSMIFSLVISPAGYAFRQERLPAAQSQRGIVPGESPILVEGGTAQRGGVPDRQGQPGAARLEGRRSLTAGRHQSKTN